MRTVLAIDEMLAHAVAKLLPPGKTEVFGRLRMHDEGPDCVKNAVLRVPCVLAIGGAMWNPLDLLERWKLSVPTVALVPEADPDTLRAADRIGVLVVMPMAGRESTTEDLIASLRFARASRSQRLDPVVVVRPYSQSRSSARVLSLASSA